MVNDQALGNWFYYTDSELQYFSLFILVICFISALLRTMDPSGCSVAFSTDITVVVVVVAVIVAVIVAPCARFEIVFVFVFIVVVYIVLYIDISKVETLSMSHDYQSLHSHIY